MAGRPDFSRGQCDRSDTLTSLDTYEPRPVLSPQVTHPSRLLLPRVPHHSIRQVGLLEHQPRPALGHVVQGERVWSVEVDSVSPAAQHQTLIGLGHCRNTLNCLVNEGQSFKTIDRNLFNTWNTDNRE